MALTREELIPDIESQKFKFDSRVYKLMDEYNMMNDNWPRDFTLPLLL